VIYPSPDSWPRFRYVRTPQQRPSYGPHPIQAVPLAAVSPPPTCAHITSGSAAAGQQQGYHAGTEIRRHHTHPQLPSRHTGQSLALDSHAHPAARTAFSTVLPRPSWKPTSAKRPCSPHVAPCISARERARRQSRRPRTAPRREPPGIVPVARPICCGAAAGRASW